MGTFQTEKLYINDLFKLWFIVPEFQRHYVWNDEQVSNLLTDIYLSFQNNREGEYFLGMIVLHSIDEEQKEYDILDGQQRILTLLLIFAVMRELTQDCLLRTTCANKIFREANPYEQIEQKLRIRFAIRNKTQTYFEEQVVPEGQILKKCTLGTDDISILNLSRAISNICDYLSGIDDLNEFAMYLLHRVAVIYVSSADMDNAFQMFTVLNNRGLKLNNGEILKAMNLAVIDDVAERQKYAALWEEAEGYFEKDFDTFLSYIRNIIKKDKASRSLVKEFEMMYEDEEIPLSKGKTTFEYISQYKDCYERLFEEENYRNLADYSVCNLLHLMKEFSSDYWIAPLLAYFSRFKDACLKEFLVQLERKFAADWVVGYSIGKRVDEMNRLIRVIEQKDDPQDIINDSVFSFEKDKLRANLDSLMYGRTCTKYLLLKLDLLYRGNQLKFDIPSFISVEHILPHTPGSTSQWVQDFSPEEMDEWTDKLGNLMLISRRKNSSLNNSDYAVKRIKYFKANIELFSNSIRIYQNYPTWTLNDLQKNQQEIIEMLSKDFGLDDCSKKVIAVGNKNLVNAYKPWKHQEEKKLMDMFDSGVPVSEIAVLFGRSEGGIYSRLQKLGYELE